MADVVSSIVSFLRGKGLPSAAIAGILGNIQIESGFNTGAANASEGAIGLAQWEGGRRTALQNYAAQHGMHETDLNAQLGYLWQELSGPYSGVLSQLKTATDPAAAAAIWDGQYEVSSGQARDQRVAAAQHFAANGLSGAGLNIQQSGGLGAMSANATSLSPADQKAALMAGIGPLSALLASVPELNGLLSQAISKGWTAEEFQNAVNNSNWYRTHSDTVRSALIKQASDPASYKKDLAQETSKVSALAGQMGVTLSAQQLSMLTNMSYMQGLTQDQLQHQLASLFNRTGDLSGQAAQIYDQLQKTASAYGQSWNDASIRYRTQQVLNNPGMMDNYTELLKKQAKAMYPGLASSIDSGLTVEDVAQPYKQTMSQLLEVSPDTITNNDRMVKQALQGTGALAKGQQPTATPLYQFEQQVKQDPRWAYTKNAHADTSALLEQLGQAWGMSAA